ncbi:hypothetical protein QFZ66_000601 [Streptomyces sp. B4I13]|uniref:Uncharacterized protein n=1 Tax=Streptomyces achromogenes TaxID=67255 RepID=A0ABU0QCD0_STRAH|nr:hypothetical protein [Streptomyces achromogenes]MDQ0835510.1 hypothetical protein [Streptomyces achromogenes]MDQ0956723.1 hypothetical protein [Streptomyces sp. B4I13]
MDLPAPEERPPSGAGDLVKRQDRARAARDCRKSR